jgi:hypothetical protein
MNLKFKFGTSSALMLLSGFLFLQRPLLADTAPATYDSCLEDVVDSVVSPMIDVMTRAGKKKISVAVVGFRELASGQRSPFCVRVEQDLTKKIKTATVFEMPSNFALKGAIDSLGGNTTDFSDPKTLDQFGQLVAADVVITGSYLVQDSVVLLKVRLLRCSDGSEVWTDTENIPASGLLPGDSTLIDGSQPAGYVSPQLPAAVKPPVEVPAFPDSSSDTSPTATVAQSFNEEDTFSWERINFGAGYMNLKSQNPTFQSVTGIISGGFITSSWADVVNAQLDFWSIPSTPLANASSLLAFAIAISATAPLRLGPYVVLYGGAGGRFESIQVGGTTLPSGDTVSYGNNSLYGVAGIKLHRGSWGIDTSLNYDFYANYSPYLTVKTGLYYELNLQ